VKTNETFIELLRKLYSSQFEHSVMIEFSNFDLFKEKLRNETFPLYQDQKFHFMIVSFYYPWFTEEMKSDWVIAVEAAKSPLLWNYLPEEFKEDVNFVVDVIKNISWSSSILRRNALLRENRNFCLVALLNSDCMTNGIIPKELMQDREFISEGVFKYGTRVLNNLPSHFKVDMEIIWMSRKHHMYIRNTFRFYNLKFYFC
jgi:hypothetical protein